MGLECYYSKYSEAREDFLHKMADRYGLLVSGGSDYHGGHKKVPIGVLGKDAPPVMEDLTVLRALGIKR